MSNEHLLAVVFTILALFSLSTGIGIVVGVCQYISYLERRDREELLRQERGSSYLVFVYFSTEDACLVGSITLFGLAQIGETLLLGSPEDRVICTGKVTRIATVAEPDPEETALWVQLDHPQMYTFLMDEQPEWKINEKVHPPK